MLIVAVLILPLLGNADEELALGFSMGFVITGWLATGTVLLSHVLVPDPAGTPPLPEKTRIQFGYSAPAANLALKSTIVVVPLASLFIIFDLGSYLLVMVFAAIFSLQPEIVAGRGQGMQSLIATLIGGIGALMFYLLIVAVPEFYFFIILMLVTTMFIGAKAFSTDQSAKYYGSAFVALLLLAVLAH